MRGFRVGVVHQTSGPSKVTFTLSLAPDDPRGHPSSAITDMAEFERERARLRDLALTRGLNPPTETAVLRETAARLTGTEWLLEQLIRHLDGGRFPVRESQRKIDMLSAVRKTLTKDGNTELARTVDGAMRVLDAKCVALTARKKELRKGTLAFPRGTTYWQFVSAEPMPCDVCRAPLLKDFDAHYGIPPIGAPDAPFLVGYACPACQPELDNRHRATLGWEPLPSTSWF